MSFEQPSQNRTTEILGKKYEVVDVSVLDPNLIEQGDRVFISTESGNRYMVRRPRSHNESLMIYNEKESGFAQGDLIYNQNQTIAKITEPMKLVIVTDEVKKLGIEINSTNVTAIEIRKGVDDILNSTPDELKTKSLTDILKNQVKGRK
jgi:hypothetical protein